MARRPPERVDPWLLAERAQILEGRIPLGALPRLAPLLVDDAGEVAYVLEFYRDESGRHRVSSRVRARLQLQCQRCLGPCTHSVEQAGELALVQGPLEARQLPPEFDPLLVEADELLEVRQLVEDELLLSLPAVPRHSERCRSDTESPQAPAAEASSPFAVLAALKGGGTNDS